jgi:hypothetical protein
MHKPERKIFKSDVITLDDKPWDGRCFVCHTRAALPNQAFCAECMRDGLTFICGKETFHFTLSEPPKDQ